MRRACMRLGARSARAGGTAIHNARCRRSVGRVCCARRVEARFECGMTRRFRWLRRLHARVVLLVTQLFRRVIGRGAQACFFGGPACVRGLVQCFFFGTRAFAARMIVLLAGGELGRVAVGCVLARILLVFAVP